MKLERFGIEVPQEEYIPCGHAACAGCGGSVSMRYALKTLGPKVMVTNPAGCSSAFARNLSVPLCRALFESSAAWASGMKAGLEIRGDTETIVLAWSGDGGTYDIGLQALSSAAERNEDFIFICYDNEAYMMTGIQRSSATPAGAWTSTTPTNEPKLEPKKDIVGIMAAHLIPYAATATIGYPRDLLAKIAKAKSIKGTRFLNLLAPCPTGWRFPPNLTVEISRLAVQSKIFPLYEVENGVRYSVQRPAREIQVREYLELQGRFSHLSQKDIESIQTDTEGKWERLISKASTICMLDT